MMMNTIHVEASHVIDARPEAVYAVLADYRVGHAAILPKLYFADLIVEKGGQGAGTVILAKMKIFGKEYTYHQLVSEPEPGRALVETEMSTGQFTRFTVDPLNSSTQSRVTIYSEFPASTGLMGFMEKLIQPPVARRIYNQELRILADYVRSQSAVIAH